MRAFLAPWRAAWRRLAGIVSSAASLGVHARDSDAGVLGFVALVPWLLASNAMRIVAEALLSRWRRCAP
ncbi:hypothetical protein [Tahibacter caeni]|uniref:hypothetical protein n=1 Tax=Tahibacter caeni TaxID=1453545 RepID=UPI0021474BEF|nr:hypothetical protein [Tahibacter caeni]